MSLYAYKAYGEKIRYREQWVAIIIELSGLWPLNSISKVERRL